MASFIRVAAAAALAAALGMGVSATGQTPPPTGQQAPPPAQAGQAGQGTQAGQKPPVFKAGVNTVRVDVIITDNKGNPVGDLTAADFEVYEDNKLQTIDLFRLVSADGNVAPGAEPARPIRSESDQETEASRDDVRLFVIFLDDYHVRKINGMRVRETLIQFVQTQLGPLDMVAIVYPLMSVNQITFTRDQTSLIASLRAFEGRKYDYRPRNPFEEQYANYPSQAVETVRNQVTMTALRGTAIRMGSLREGRKALILVSEGFSSLLPPQLRDPNAQMPGFGNPNQYNAGAGNNIYEERARFTADSELMSDLREVFNTANQQNTAIYALDPRGLSTGEFDVSDNASIGIKESQDFLRATQDTLQVLTANTDGRAIINRNDLDRGLKQVVRDTSAYYLLGYNSSLTTPDGKFHEIKVKVKRPGLQVRSRKGYWAPTVDEAAKMTAPPKPPTPPAVEKALGAVQSRPRDAYVSTWVGTAAAPAGKTRVTFVWEPVPPVPGEKRQDVATLRLIVTARGEELFNGEVIPPASASGAPAAAGAAPGPKAPSKITFDAPPGKVTARIVALNDKGEALDGYQQELSVPDFSTAAVRITTPAVFRTRTAREFQALSRDPDPVPTSMREFRRTERLLIRFGVYGAGSAPEVTAVLLNRLGQKMTDVPLQAPAEPGAPFSVDLPLASFSPGDYVIELRVKGTPNDATELIAIKITS